MAMTKCKECGKEISTKAAQCPHCGARGPGLTEDQKNTVGGVFLVLVVLAVTILVLRLTGGDDADAGPELTEEEQAEQAAAEAAAEEEAAAACRADAECWGREHLSRALWRCSEAVERLAQYDVEWTQDGPFRFPHVGWADEEAGVLRYIGDAARFSNAFGATRPHAYMCDFDPEAREVVDVTATEGRL